MTSGFKNLIVWKKSKDLAVEVYRITRMGYFNRDYALRDQLRRSAVSIPSNIAEGDERGSNKDSVRFLFIAKGSLAELMTQIEIAHEIGYLNKEIFFTLEKRCIEIGKMLGSLIKART
ncbi:MAG: four helix bundle protein, partial [Thermodesulfobacteriota bacterium]